MSNIENPVNEHEAEVPIRGLSSKQLKTLTALASGQRPADVAESVGVAVGTIHNWCSGNPKFKAELARFQESLYKLGCEALKGVSLEAVHTLHDVMKHPEASARDRVAAARAVLSLASAGKQRAATNDAATSIVKILGEWKS